MYVPLCTVALTDVYKLPSDGGSGSSHINHSHRWVPHFQSSSAALTACFFSPHLLEAKRSFFLFKWKLFSNNSKIVPCVVLCSPLGVWLVLFLIFTLVTSIHTLSSCPINHPSSRYPLPNHLRSACVILCLCFMSMCVHGHTFSLCFKHNSI